MFLVHVLNSIAAAVNVKFGPINVDSEYKCMYCEFVQWWAKI